MRQLLRHAASEVIPLNGTGEGESDPGMLLALARFEGAPCVLLGQDRSTQTELEPLGPGALRAARRGMRLAAELRLPLVTVIDTPGAALSPEAEEGGLAGEIARCLADLVTLQSPSVTVLLGQGCGGGALALLPADRVIAAQHAWLSPLPPEGASAIMHRTPDRAPEMARQQGVRASDLQRRRDRGPDRAGAARRRRRARGVLPPPGQRAAPRAGRPRRAEHADRAGPPPAALRRLRRSAPAAVGQQPFAGPGRLLAHRWPAAVDGGVLTTQKGRPPRGAPLVVRVVRVRQPRSTIAATGPPPSGPW